jgi:O-antigen ligase
MNQTKGLPPAIAVAAVVIFAFLFGGGGSRFGVANLTVQLAAFAALAAYPARCLAFWREAPISLRVVVAATLLLPLLQLLPLPAAMWSTLPGRDLALRSFELVGPDSWSPLSLYPLRTALAASALVTPAVILMLGWQVPRAHLFALAWLFVGLGLATAMAGAIQISSNYTALTYFDEGLDVKALRGLFANRNSTGLFLVGALALALCLPAPRPHPGVLLARLSVAALLLAAIILTKSRTALVLSLIPVALGLVRLASAVLQQHGAAGTRARQGWVIAAAILALGFGGVAATAITAPGRLGEAMARFEGFEQDPRRYIWDDASYSAARYWPAGAGIGTFDDVFQVDESLENLGMRRAGRAHNDYLEILIEAGLAGIALAGLWLVLVAAMAWQARRSADRWGAWAASGFLVAIALQSVTDYPLRTETILAAGALAMLLLARIAVDGKGAGA